MGGLFEGPELLTWQNVIQVSLVQWFFNVWSLRTHIIFLHHEVATHYFLLCPVNELLKLFNSIVRPAK